MLLIYKKVNTNYFINTFVRFGGVEYYTHTYVYTQLWNYAYSIIDPNAEEYLGAIYM
jgi:hypothetical protein